MPEKKENQNGWNLPFAIAFFSVFFMLVIVNGVINFMNKNPITIGEVEKVQNIVDTAENRFDAINFTLMSKIIDSQWQVFLKNAQIAIVKQNSEECRKVDGKFNTFQVIGSYFGLKNNKDYCGAINTVKANMALNQIFFLSYFWWTFVAIVFTVVLLVLAFWIFYKKISKIKDSVDREALKFFAFIPYFETKEDAKKFLATFGVNNPLFKLKKFTSKDTTEKTETRMINIDELRKFVHNVVAENFIQRAKENKEKLQNSKQYKFAEMSANLMRYMTSSVMQEKTMTGDPYPASISGHHNPDEKYGLLTHTLHVAYVMILNAIKRDDFLDNYLELFYTAVCHDLDKIRNYRQSKAMPSEVIDALDVKGESIKEKMAKIEKARANEWLSYKLDETAQRNIFIQLSTKFFPTDEQFETIKKYDQWSVPVEIIYTGLDRENRHNALAKILENVATKQGLRKHFLINQIESAQVDVVGIEKYGSKIFVFHENFFKKLSGLFEKEFKERKMPYELILKLPLLAGADKMAMMFQYFFYEVAKEGLTETQFTNLKNILLADNTLQHSNGSIINGNIYVAIATGKLENLYKFGITEEDFSIKKVSE